MVPQQAPRQLRRRIRRSPKSAVAAANNSLSAQAQPSSESLENSVDTGGHNTRPASSLKSAKVHNLCCTSSAGRAARSKPALVDMDTVAEASGRCSTDALASCCGGAIGYLAIRALYPAPPGVAADVADTDVTAIMDTASGVQRR